MKAVAYRIGRAVAQHFGAKSVVIGFDARETSPAFAAAASQGARDAGADVMNIGMAGTEEMYWAVTEFGACAGLRSRLAQSNQLQRYENREITVAPFG